jgi:hypothetical protein
LKHGGLADKNEDVMEFDDRIWKGEKKRTGMVKNFQTCQEHCLPSEGTRRMQHHKVRFAVERFRRERKREKTPAEKKVPSTG